MTGLKHLMYIASSISITEEFMCLSIRSLAVMKSFSKHSNAVAGRDAAEMKSNAANNDISHEMKPLHSNPETSQVNCLKLKSRKG